MNTVLVKGPISFNIIGECNILGVKFNDTCVNIKSNKMLPIEKSENSKLIINKNINQSNQIMRVFSQQDKIGTSIWKTLVDNLLELNRKRIIIIGPTDAGKSTFTLFLANKFLQIGIKPLIVDGDLGQGDLAPPGCIGASPLTKQCIDLEELKTHYIRFIGNIQPINYVSRIIHSIKNLVNQYGKHQSVTIINTDGYVDSNGFIYKIDLMKKINPDCIIYLGDIIKDKEFISYTYRLTPQYLKPFCMYGCRPSLNIRRSIFERRMKRLRCYSRFLGNNKFFYKVHINKINYIYYKNKIININKIIQYHKNPNSNKKYLQQIFDKTFMKDRFVGLSKTNDFNNIIGFGIIQVFYNNFFYIRSSVKNFDNIFISDLKLIFNSTNSTNTK